MQNHRMYSTYEICDTDDDFQMTVAIKKEKNPEDTNRVSRESDNVVRFPWRENPVSENIGRVWFARNSVVIDSRMNDGDADPCVKKRRLRAHWEHIEGVGLRCTWIEEPEGESNATPDGKTKADGVDSPDNAEPDSGADAE
ncbi:MAG TPA: hypothetical protein VGN31_17870 [Paraburkholderia sp.]|jgi:hypothetical protein